MSLSDSGTNASELPSELRSTPVSDNQHVRGFSTCSRAVERHERQRQKSCIARPPLRDGGTEEDAFKVAEALARSLTPTDLHGDILRLARALRGVDGEKNSEPLVYRDAVRAFGAICYGATSYEEEDLLNAFENAWLRVRCPGNATPLTVAFEKARQWPIRLLGPLAGRGPKFERVLSTFYWLQLDQGEKDVFGAVEELAALLTEDGLRCSHTAVSDITGIAEIRGVLIRRPYKRRHGRAQTWRFNFACDLFEAPRPTTDETTAIVLRAPQPAPASGVTIPADFALTPERRKIATELYLPQREVPNIFARFCAHWRAQPRRKCDWEAAWSEWCLAATKHHDYVELVRDEKRVRDLIETTKALVRERETTLAAITAEWTARGRGLPRKDATVQPSHLTLVEGGKLAP